MLACDDDKQQDNLDRGPPRLGDDLIGDGRPNGLGRLLLLEPAVEHGGQLLHVEGADGRTWDAAEAETETRGLRSHTHTRTDTQRVMRTSRVDILWGCTARIIDSRRVRQPGYQPDGGKK